MREEKKNDKIIAIYCAIEELVAEGADLSSMRVSDIAEKAGIGKGTTYEYFSSKEEMIIKAMVYLVDSMVKRILARMEKLENFREKFHLLLEEMEEKAKQRACVLKYLNMLSDMNLCQQMRDILVEDEEAKKSSPIVVIRYLIEQGKKEGIIAESLSMDYLETTMFSRVISFMLYVDGNWGKPQENTMGIKQEIYAGLCKELG